MDPTRKRLIKSDHAISRQEQDPLKVFQEAEKDRNQSITANVVQLAPFEEDVSFVEQEESTPAVGDVDDLAKALFKVTTFDTKFANGDHVEGLLQ